MFGRSLIFIPALFLASWAAAFELTKEDLQVAGYVDGGRFQLQDTSVNGEIVNRMGAKWRIDKEIDENWSALATLHWMFWRNQRTDLALFHIAGLKFDSDLQGMITYKNDGNRVRFGLYEFKYNPDSKNLGEYLLRAEAYPTLLESSQGKDLLTWSHSRVAGLEHGLDLDMYRQTLLVYLEQSNQPVNDVNLAYIGAVGSETAELGFGAAWHRAFKLGEKNNDNDLKPSLKQYVKDQGLDSRALKFSLRGRVDFGAKLYGELALLGLKNDTLYYKNMMQRLPMMAGVDIPTGGFFESLSLEVEYFKNPYYGRKYSIRDATGGKASPLPSVNEEEYEPANIPNFTKDDLKWSFYAHKALNKWVDFKVRLASDHLRLLGWDGDYATGEALTKSPKDWYFLARIEYHN